MAEHVESRKSWIAAFATVKLSLALQRLLLHGGPQHDQERLHIRISYRNTSSTCCSQSSKQISLAPERNAGTLSKLLEIQCPFHTLPTQRSRCGWQLSRCSWQPQQHPGLGAGRGPLRGGCPEVTSPKTKNNIGSWDSLPRGPAFWRQLRRLDFRNSCSTHSKKRPLRHGLLKRHHSDAGVLLQATRTLDARGCQALSDTELPGTVLGPLPPCFRL